MKSKLHRLALAGALMALLTGIVSVVTPTPAATAATSCYGGQIEIPIRTYTFIQYRFFPENGSWFSTTTRCNDIQVRLVSWDGTGSWPFEVSLCWSNDVCEPHHLIQQNNANPKWTIISWNVPNNYTFSIRIRHTRNGTYSTGGYVAA